MPEFTIVTDQARLHRLLDDIRLAADQQKEALGFLPASAYNEAAARGTLISIVSEETTGSRYAGHILYGGAYPHAAVFQVCVHPKYQRQGLATRLLRELVARLEFQSFLTVKAQIASDLEGADKLYDRMGFELLREREGGKARRRVIRVRVKDLDTPSLLRLPTIAPSAPLPVALTGTSTPVYLFDLNVLHDLKSRRPRRLAAGSIMAACFAHAIRLEVAQEFLRELERTSKDHDPLLELARSLPIAAEPSGGLPEDLLSKLAQLVFPNQLRDYGLSERDKSDVRHLATAISVGAAGFITSDDAILERSLELRQQLGLDILGAEEFAGWLEEVSPNEEAVRGAHDLSVRPVRDLSPEIVRAILGFGETEETLSAIGSTQPGQRPWTYVGCWEGPQLIGLLALQSGVGFHQPALVAILARQTHAASATVCDLLLDRGIRAASANHLARLELLEIPGHSVTRRAAIAHGFQLADKASDRLWKLAVGTPILSDNWQKIATDVSRCSGLSLPHQPPQFEHHAQPIIVTSEGRNFEIPLERLEQMLSPAMIILPGETGVVTPIVASYAEDLLGSSQFALLPKPEAALRSQRTYLCTPRAGVKLRPGRPILFYESKRDGRGRGAAIAVARITTSAIYPKDRVPEEIRRLCVVADANLDSLSSASTILATTFEHLIMFRRPVTISELRKIGATHPNNFVTTVDITSDALVGTVTLGTRDA